MKEQEKLHIVMYIKKSLISVKTNQDFSADLYEESEVLFYPEIVHSSAEFYNSKDKKAEVDSVFIVAINNRSY